MDNTSNRPSLTPQRLPVDFLASLHARNIDSKEALKLERSQAVAAQHVAYTKKAAMNAKLRAKSVTPTGVKKTKRPDHSNSDQDGPLQNRPTSRTAIALSDVTLDWPVASNTDIQGRWQTSLLAGGTHNSVSLSQKEQRIHSAAAIALGTCQIEFCLLSCRQYCALLFSYHPCSCGTGNFRHRRS